VLLEEFGSDVDQRARRVPSTSSPLRPVRVLRATGSASVARGTHGGPDSGTLQGMRRIAARWDTNLPDCALALAMLVLGQVDVWFGDSMEGPHWANAALVTVSALGLAWRRTRPLAMAAEERGRIARELHDIVSHGLGIVVVQAGAAEQVLDREPERARDALRVDGRWVLVIGLPLARTTATAPA